MTELSLTSLVRSHSQALSRTGRPKSSRNGMLAPASGNSAARKPAGALIVGFEPQAAVLEWPRDSRNQFHGVQMTVLVQENIC